MDISTEGFDAPDEPLTELRVHGVGGSSPTSLMGVPHVGLVAGTLKAGFYRSAKWIPLGEPRRNLEGYSWGGITSRGLSRALWAVLLPFALVNLAGWMFPHRGTATEATRRGLYENVMLGLFRLMALAATATATAFVGIILIDVIGMRCVATAACTEPALLAPLRWWAWQDMVQGAALGAIGAAGVILLVGLIARLGQARLQAIDTSVRDDPAYRDRIATEMGDHGAIWYRGDVANRLGLAHTAVALALIALILIEAVGAVVELPTSLIWIRWITVALLALEIGLVAKLDLANGTVHLGLTITSALLVVVAAFAAWLQPSGVTTFTSPPLDNMLWIIFGGVAIGWFVTLIADSLRSLSALLSKRAKRFRLDSPARFTKAILGWTLSTRLALAFTGIGLIVAFGSGFLVRAADLFNVPYDTARPAWVAFYAVAWLVALGVGAFLIWLSRAKREHREIAEAYADSTLDLRSRADRKWLRSIARAEAAAAVTDKVGGIFVSATLIALITAGVMWWNPNGWAGWVFNWMVPPATWVMGLLPLIAIGTVERLIRSPKARRGFGIVWDIATFWPRWFHPWAPPSYGEFAVPHLQERLRELTATGDVILSAHSQGTVLTAAALARLDDAQLRRIHYLTHGCPLSRLYERFFPEHFDQALFAQLRERMRTSGRDEVWTNLYRRTDYIGGCVFTDPTAPGWSDIAIRDPFNSEPHLKLDPRPTMLRHSNYYATPEYTQTLERCAEAFGNPSFVTDIREQADQPAAH